LYTLRFTALFGSLGSAYTIHYRLIGKRVVHFLVVLIELFFASCYGWGATSEYQIGAVARSFATAKRLTLVSKCLTTLSLTVFTQRNFVADFLQAKCDFKRKKGRFAFLSLGGLRGHVRWSS